MTPGRKECCAVVITAIREEFLAVRRHLREPVEECHPSGTVYEVGRFAGLMNWKVAVVETGSGNTVAAIEAERAISYFRPSVLLFVGIAGGVKDVQLGDVVAATKVYGYEAGKATDIFLPRPDVGQSSFPLIQRARAEARKADWTNHLQEKPKVPPAAHVGAMAAGEKVVASTKSQVYRFLKKTYSDALAVEMEGRGILAAAHANHPVNALIVRGVSDLIDKKDVADSEGYQRLAAEHASAFAFQVLAQLDSTARTMASLARCSWSSRCNSPPSRIRTASIESCNNKSSADHGVVTDQVQHGTFR